MRRSLVLALAAGTAFAQPAATEDWSRFRGPNGTGVSTTAAKLPDDLDPAGAVWKTPLAPGHSSPALTKDRIFVTAHEGETLLVLCLERASGKILWRREVPRNGKGPLQNVNGPASPSPVTDGRNVIAFFQDFGLISFTADGRERWRLPLGPFRMFYGFGASPVLVDDKVILPVDQDLGSYLIAVAKDTGRVLWKVDRPEVISGYSTPTEYRPKSGPKQVIVPESFQLSSYSVVDGKRVWFVRGLACEMKSVASYDDEYLYVNGWGFPQNQAGQQVPTVPFEEGLAKYDKDGDGAISPDELASIERGSADRMGAMLKSAFEAFDADHDQKLDAKDWRTFRAMMAAENGLLSIKLGGQGDQTASAIRWRYQRPVPQVPSTLLYNGVLFMVNDSGILISFDPATGRVIKQGRLKGAIDKYFASPVGGDGKMYLVSQDGTVSVVEAKGEWEVLRVSALGDEVFATPVLTDDGQVLVRTKGSLISFAKRPASALEALPPRFADPNRRAKLEQAFPEIEKIVADAVARQKFPGAAFGVVIDGELVFEKGFGLRDVASNAPATPDTAFRIASMTKSFTAVAILKLRDEGKLSLDDPASKYVPEMASLQPATKDSPPITIRHLLSHSAGLPEDNPWGDRQLAQPDDVLGRWISGGIPFSNAPGVAYEYSNYGFALLGRIVSRVSGMPYRDYIDKNVLLPLGMTSSKWDAGPFSVDRVAQGYRRESDSWALEPALADGAFGAMGGLYSTVRDLARYTSFFLSAWPPRDDADPGPLRRSSAREMQQAQRLNAARAARDTVDGTLRLNLTSYAFGLGMSSSCRFDHVVAHSGGLPGFGSQMRWLPKHGVAIVGLANLTYASWGRIGNDVLDALDKTGALAPRVAQPSPSLLAARDSVDRLIDKWDDALLDSFAADNLLLDVPRDKRHAQLEELRKRHGACPAAGATLAENALRGRWRLDCDWGAVGVAVTLAPTNPPRVQFLGLTSVPALGEPLRRVADRVTGLTQGATAANLDGLLAAGADRAATLKTLAAAAAWGGCRRGETLRGDGDVRAAVRLECDLGRLDADVTIDKASGLLKSLTLVPALEETCVP